MRLLILTVATASALGSQAAGALTIDDFTRFQSVSITMPGENAGSRVSGSGILGGTRGLTLQDSSGGVPVAAEIESGLLQYSQEGSGQALIQLTWNGDPHNGELGGLDFTEGGAHDSLALQIVDQTLGGLLWVNVCTGPALSENSTCSRATYSSGGQLLGPGLHLFPYSDFVPLSGDGPADFTRVDRVVMRFQATGPGVLAVSSLATIPKAQLPTLSPLSQLALMAGLLGAGLGVWRRRGAR
jgi:hypothetical protein